MLFPPHEHIVVMTGIQLSPDEAHVLRKPLAAEGRELAPVLPVRVLVRVPLLREKRVPTTVDDRPFEVRRELGKLVSQSRDLQVSAQEGLGDVDVFYLHFHVIFGPPALLLADELGARQQAKERVLHVPFRPLG